MKQSSQVLEGEQQKSQIIDILKKLKKRHNLVSEHKFLDENLLETNQFYIDNITDFLNDLQFYSQYISKQALEENTKIKTILSLYQAHLFDNLEKNIPTIYQLNSQKLTLLETNIHYYLQYLEKIRNIFPSYQFDAYYQQRQAYILNKISHLVPNIYQMSENNEQMRKFYYNIYQLTHTNNSFLGKLN
jgi:hypothetical protein